MTSILSRNKNNTNNNTNTNTNTNDGMNTSYTTTPILYQVNKEYNESDYNKFRLVGDDTFVRAIQIQLDLHNISHPQSVESFKRFHKIKPSNSEENNVIQISNYYNCCIYIRDFTNDTWVIVGDTNTCKYVLYLFYEKNEFGVLIKHDRKHSKRLRNTNTTSPQTQSLDKMLRVGGRNKNKTNQYTKKTTTKTSKKSNS